MTKDEFIEFSNNDFELLEDEEWDSYSLLNGLILILIKGYLFNEEAHFKLQIKNYFLDKVDNLPIDWKHLLNE